MAGARDLRGLIGVCQSEDGCHVGEPTQFSLPRIFGGQVIGQALAAANTSVPAGKTLHSMHAYFLRPGRPDTQVGYRVTSTRDGASFAGREVAVHQSGIHIASVQASYHRAEVGFDHQHRPHPAVGPDGLADLEELRRRTPGQWQDFYGQWPQLDVRPVPKELIEESAPTTSGRSARSQVWIRSRQTLDAAGEPDRRALLACLSDLVLLSVAMVPHGVAPSHDGVLVASLDHSVWFHRDVLLEDWLLYDMTSPTAAGGRGLCRGEFYDRAGRHIATVMQEGLIRPIDGRSG